MNWFDLYQKAESENTTRPKTITKIPKAKQQNTSVGDLKKMWELEILALSILIQDLYLQLQPLLKNLSVLDIRLLRPEETGAQLQDKGFLYHRPKICTLIGLK
uniref:Uncharacterized protein n=1 Tax=Romanomermis culicivorax TaxID=13658 RepID=A0A915HGE3_ROMCU